MTKGKKAVVKFSLIILSLFVVSIMAIYAYGVFANTHTNSAELKPEWSPHDQWVDYNVELCNTGSIEDDPVDEIRIYKNPDYGGFENGSACVDKEGWEKTFIYTKKACHYIATDTKYYIEPGKCETFGFSAKTPESGCEMNWKFETRDIDEMWLPVYDTTSVDDLKPEISKVITGTQSENCPPEDGEECWINQNTEIKINVEEKGVCGISGLEYCKISYAVDGSLPVEEINADLNGNTSWSYTMSFDEDSVHVLTIECKDIAGNKVEDIETFKVDTTSPTTAKNYGLPFYTNGISEWISTSTPITLSATDGGEICAAGVDKTWYLNLLVSDEFCKNKEACQPLCDNPFTCKADGVCHNIEIAVNWCQEECEDNNWKNTDYDSFEECVESCGYYCCDGTWHSNRSECGGIGLCDLHCDHKEYDGLWQLYNEPFYKTEESCHLIQFFSVDELGNYEKMKHQCVFVDNTIPNITKEVGEPKIEGDGSTFDYWITKETPINLHCQDQEPHPSNNVVIYWKWRLDEGNWNEGSYPGEDYTLYFNDQDSIHELEIWCKDALGLESEHDIEKFKVDSTAPEIEKTMIGEDHLGHCPPEDGENCYVKGDGENGVKIEVSDPDPTGKGCSVDDITCKYELWWEDEKIKSDEFGEEGVNILFDRDSAHTLKIHCEDALGNYIDDEEVFYVDKTAPATTKTYGEPKIIKDEGDWINSQTPIILTAKDEKVGVNVTQYRVSGTLADRFCENCEAWMKSLRPDMGPWNTYINPFTISEDSCHVIEYRSIDRLINEEEIKWQCVYVDNAHPEVNVSTSNPKIECEEGENCDYWIMDHKTEITLECNDQEPHPSGVRLIEYRWKLDDGNFTEWLVYEEPIIFEQDSVHTLESRCTDNLGNEAQGPVKIYRVDSTAPEIEKIIQGSRYGDCLPEEEGDICYLDGETTIEVKAIDPDQTGKGCNIGDVTCKWGYYLDDGKFYSWYDTFPIQFPEETKHKLIIHCEDALGNSADDEEVFYVDKTAPATTKTYGEPKIIKDEGDWINSDTPITLAVEDEGQHKSGVKETKYRYEKIDDVYCNKLLDVYCAKEITADWQTYTGEFKIGEDSCHKIEYYSVDNVNKTEKIKAQCVYVDNAAPTPVKEVGEPKTKWDGEDSIFYKEETKNCWIDGEGKIDCWKVTLGTPISMTCTDPEPHPVDNEKICFNVEVDGDDMTSGESEYCKEYGGTMQEDGYCCLNRIIENFTFLESTEHNLKFYCTDALGNTNQQIDEEKFKVEGNGFEIQLNKKWNLISVPVVLLNDDPKEVFKGAEDCVKSIWTYDGKEDEWHVFTLDGPSDLKIEPGYGYWIIANKDCKLTIGGSLLSPGRTPPSRTLVPGWNLIGYYGIDGQEGYYVPEGNGKDAYCALWSLTSGELGLPKWSALNGYWELNNPEFEDYSIWDNLDPGAGYWVNMKDNQQEYIYSPSTVCEGWLSGYFPII